MEWRTAVAWVAAAIALLGCVPYVRAVLRGASRPQRATWITYLAVGVCAVASSWAAGGRASLLVPLAYAIGPLAILAVAIRRGEGGWSPLDRACLAIVGLGLAGWAATGDPRVGVWLHTAADIAGTVPTLRRAWRDPAAEPRLPWLMFVAASLLNLLVIGAWTVGEALYPCGLLLTCLAVSAALLRPHHSLR